MGNSGCFWEASLVSQKRWVRDTCHNKLCIEIDILKFLLPVLIIVAATHIITFTEWN